MSTNIDKLTDREVVDLMQSATPLAKARAIFSARMGQMEQAEAQRKPPSIIERRKMEFKAAQAIAKELGVDL